MNKKISSLTAIVIVLSAVVVFFGGLLAYQYWVAPRGQEVPTIQYGTIKGFVNYPSDFIPKDLRVCALNSETKKEFCAPYILSGHNYVYKIKVPVGNYYIFSTTTYDGITSRAFYSEFVVCGLEYNCPSHDLILVKVISGQVVKNINPYDWYYTGDWKIIIETAGWKLFTDDKVGYSLKYPPDLKVEEISINGLKENITRIILPIVSAAGLPPNTWGFKSDFLVFDIYREKLQDISNEASFHPGYPGLTTKEDISGDKQALENGEFGLPYLGLESSRKVIKIDDKIYGKEFTTLGMFEVCDVLPTRTLIFFKNGYKVSVVLQAWAVDKIELELPQYFKTDQENCGNSLVWDKQNQFYNDLTSGTISSETEAGIWYNTFDKIVSTIDFFDVSSLEDQTIDWKTYRNEEYGFEFKYPNQIDLGAGAKQIIVKENQSPVDAVFVAYIENPFIIGFAVEEKPKNFSNFKSWVEDKVNEINSNKNSAAPISAYFEAFSVGELQGFKIETIAADVLGNTDTQVYFEKSDHLIAIRYSYSKTRLEEQESTEVLKYDTIQKILSTLSL